MATYTISSTYSIDEPYVGTPEAREGNVPFFYVLNENNVVVFSAVTRQECIDWINDQ